jgi:6-phosphogluconolactonase
MRKFELGSGREVTRTERDRRQLGRRDFMTGLAGVTFAAYADRSIPQFMYVGSYTSDGRGHGEGISIYRRTAEGNAWSLIQVVNDFADPSFLTIDRQGRCLYSAHGDGTRATAYRIDSATGRLNVINQQPSRGTNGVHVAVDPTNRFLALANYATGTLALLPINPDGSLAPVSDMATLTGTPGPHRTEQQSSHPHHCPFDPSGRFIVVPDKGLDRIFVYRLDVSTGRLVAADPPSVAARSGAAPRHVDFHPTKPFAYVINEIDSTIAAYAFDAEKGALKPLQILPTVPSTYTANNTGAEIRVAPSGRFVYGSNRGHDSIAIFAVDGRTGMLTVVGWEPTRGRTPRYFGLDPSGTHLYAANQNSDTVVIFLVNQTSGKLTRTGELIKVGSPSTIAFR